jgi:hypothetical protein
MSHARQRLEETNVKSLEKLSICDEAGTDVAYINNGVVYSSLSGRRIATLLGGVIYGTDGQSLGRRTPTGAIRGVDGIAPEAFMRLVKRE